MNNAESKVDSEEAITNNNTASVPPSPKQSSPAMSHQPILLARTYRPPPNTPPTSYSLSRFARQPASQGPWSTCSPTRSGRQTLDERDDLQDELERLQNATKSTDTQQ